MPKKSKVMKNSKATTYKREFQHNVEKDTKPPKPKPKEIFDGYKSPKKQNKKRATKKKKSRY